MAALSGEFPRLAADDSIRLRALANDLLSSPTEKIADQMYTIAHDLKGQGGSFGFPVVSAIAASLCCLLREASVRDPDVVAALRAHADAIALALENGMAGPPDTAASTMIGRLRQMNADLALRKPPRRRR